MQKAKIKIVLEQSLIPQTIASKFYSTWVSIDLFEIEQNLDAISYENNDKMWKSFLKFYIKLLKQFPHHLDFKFEIDCYISQTKFSYSKIPNKSLHSMKQNNEKTHQKSTSKNET